MDLVTRRLRGAQAIAGPLLFLEGVPRVRLGEVVRIRLEGGGPDEERSGQVIAISPERVAVQVLEETRGLAPARVEVTLTGEVARLGVSRAMLGRVLDGLGRPTDGLPPPIPEARPPIHGAPINVTRRA
ncbi:MAG TPA: V-type ATP synthase subunit B, partial [Anaeromyxobacter sp.]|nr:V-type ATP synthase subunit B [Anaeromyxobacter sp.]